MYQSRFAAFVFSCLDPLWITIKQIFIISQFSNIVRERFFFPPFSNLQCTVKINFLYSFGSCSVEQCLPPKWVLFPCLVAFFHTSGKYKWSPFFPKLVLFPCLVALVHMIAYQWEYQGSLTFLKVDALPMPCGIGSATATNQQVDKATNCLSTGSLTELQYLLV